jgi:hypothetical protein
METNDDLTTRIMNALNALPAEEQNEMILAVVSAALKDMSVYRLLAIRADICADLNAELPLVRATIELIDGQLILREIAGDDGWR